MDYIDLVLWLTYLLVAAAIAATGWSLVHAWQHRSTQQTALEKRHTDKTGLAAAALLLATLALTFLQGSAEPIPVNGKIYADAFWLKVTDMFIFTSIILIALCSAIVAIARFRR